MLGEVILHVKESVVCISLLVPYIISEK